MKQKTYGVDIKDTETTDSYSPGLWHFVSEFSEYARAAYRKSRSNGPKSTDPSRAFPEDGKAEAVRETDCNPVDIEGTPPV